MIPLEGHVVDGQAHEIGRGKQHIYFAALHQAGDFGRKLRRQECGVGHGFGQFEHKVKVVATRRSVQPGTKYPHTGMVSRSLKGKLADGLGLVVGQAHCFGALKG